LIDFIKIRKMLFVVKENLIPNNNNNDDDDKNLIKLKLGYVCTI
jgi:hypothetical protein